MSHPDPQRSSCAGPARARMGPLMAGAARVESMSSDRKLEGLDAVVSHELASSFELEGAIGTGPRSVVYRAREIESGELVTVKVIPRGNTGEVSVDAFSRVFRAVAGLHHEHIVSVQRAGMASDFFW